MAHCKQCGSNAYNQYNLHGREPGVDVDLCDVCYWRKRAERMEAEKGYWVNVATDYAMELSGYDRKHEVPQVNGVDLAELEKSVNDGYSASTATQLDLIAIAKRTFK